MRLSELNPRRVWDKVLWFDCPRHRGDKSAPCHGECGVLLCPPVPGGWRWSGDWSTWSVTLQPSWRSELCGAHFEVVGGEVTVYP